jgi:hypothetical protein
MSTEIFLIHVYLEIFLIHLENDVRQGKITLDQGYEKAFLQIKPSSATYRKEMKPHMDALQAWYEQQEVLQLSRGSAEMGADFTGGDAKAASAAEPALPK